MGATAPELHRSATPHILRNILARYERDATALIYVGHATLMRDVQQMDFHLWVLQALAIGELGGRGRPWRKSRSPSDYESVADSIGVADTRAVISYPFHVAGAAEGVVVAHAFANFYVITT